MSLERYVQHSGKQRDGADCRAITTPWTEGNGDQGRAMAGAVGGGLWISLRFLEEHSLCQSMAQQGRGKEKKCPDFSFLLPLTL